MPTHRSLRSQDWWTLKGPPTRWPINLKIAPQGNIDFPEDWSTFNLGLVTQVYFNTTWHI